MTASALSGIRVLELGDFVAAPYCARMLADMGADVIKVERPPDGDSSRRYGPFLDDAPHPERSGLFLYMNANKRGVTLDVETPTGRALLHRLLGQMDVFVVGLAPREMDALGLAPATLHAAYPRLVITSLTPYGLTGPYRDRRANDLTCSAAGGATFLTGRPEREPLTQPCFQSDHQCGISGIAATVAALLMREATGEGQTADISETDVMASIYVGANVTSSIAEGHDRQRTGVRYPGHYPDSLFRVKDGHICLNCPQIVQWVRFLEAMGTPEWTKDPRYRNRKAMAQQYPDEVDRVMTDMLKDRTKAELYAIGQERRVPIAMVQTAEDLYRDPHLRAREYFVRLAHAEVGEREYPGAPYKFSRTPWRALRPAPLYGEHNEQVYCGMLGCSRDDLVALRRTGVV